MARRSMGSRGSSSSGGSSRSSFSSSSSSRSSFSSGPSRSSRPSGGWHMGHGHHHHSSIHIHGAISSTAGKIIAVCALLFFGILFSIAGGMLISNSNSLLEVKKADYEHYQQMITYAEQHPEYQAKGRVYYVDYDEEVNGYYFEYRVKNEEFSTFACYDWDTVPSLGSEILVALDCPIDEFSSFSDTMPMSYKNTTLNDDGEYRSIKTTRNMGIISLLVGLTVSAVGIVIIFKSKNTKETAPADEPKLEETPTPVVENTKTYCAYCGAENDKTRIRCHSCGARIGK